MTRHVKLSDLPPHLQEQISAQLLKPAPRVPPDCPELKPTRHELNLERDDQRLFYADCRRRGLVPVWHATNSRSKATPGTPDFIVPVAGTTLWIEMKLPGKKLSNDQQAFQASLAAQGIQLHVVYSLGQAIELVRRALGDSALDRP
jgi:hypothetical protein